MSLVTPPEKYLINTSETIQKNPNDPSALRFYVLPQPNPATDWTIGEL